ncbi:MAG: hypothetical protein HKN17_00985, partial [Rhodothermales bacterium]|nr:hypothetical protein [Rhodothermales bacterium]
FISRYRIDDATVADFLDIAARHGVVVGDREAPADMDEQSVERFDRSAVDEDDAFLRVLIKGRLATRLYDRTAWYRVYQDVDHILDESQQLWSLAEYFAVQYAEAR